MQREYSLRSLPLTYENLRKLEYSSEFGRREAEKKISPYLQEGEIRLVSSSGCSVSRTNDVLVRNLGRVSKKCRLYLVGNSDLADERTIRRLISDNDLQNITLLGQLNQDELKYLISQSDIGIVNYGQYDTNNRLCASGKLYEFLYEGKPVVTTTNPPLKRICDEEGIGVSDDEYFRGINKITDEYDAFSERVVKYTHTHTICDNDRALCESIVKRINSIQ